MERVLFSEKFKRHMSLLAMLTGIIISISMPSSYLALSLIDEKKEAIIHSREMAEKLEEAVKDNPDLWQYNIPKFIKIFSEENSHLSIVTITSASRGVVFTEQFSKPFIFDIKSSAKITYNNKVFGSVEVLEKTSHAILLSSLLFFIFTLLGLVIALLLYRFPYGIVSRAENQVIEVFQELKFLSNYDPLTNLPNRFYFRDYLEQAIIQARLKTTQIALLFMDLDGFKAINDSFGHDFGDLVLQSLAKRLSECVQGHTVVSRLGGDEFTVILEDVFDKDEINGFAKKIIASICPPLAIHGYEFYVTASIGISIYPEHGEDVENLIKNADTAMYHAKEKGKNQYRFYSPRLTKIISDKLKLENILRKALEEEQTILSLHYQPMVNLKTGCIDGAEALLRLQEPELGLVFPSKFIPVAEETGLIFQLGKWVLKNACAQAKKWHEQGSKQFYISVNISPYQFQQLDLVETITEALKETGLDAQYLQLEITEEISRANDEFVIGTLHAIRKIGIKVAIDDFGIGYSSLNRLKTYPINALKIDKLFVSNLPGNIQDAVIAQFVIAMANNLKLKIIAEGVETKEQLDFLREHNCDEAQGYLFSRPLSCQDFSSLLAKGTVFFER